MLKEVLDAALTKSQQNAGLHLEEDEDFIYLYGKEGKRRAVFSSKGATIKAIREAADRVIM